MPVRLVPYAAYLIALRHHRSPPPADLRSSLPCLLSRVRSHHPIFRGEQCTRGAFARVDEGEEASGRVVADVARLSAGGEEYYLRELATDHEQYLSGHGESPGRWYGAGASSLGLEGEASGAGFGRVVEG